MAVDVLTRSYNNRRTGVNLGETALTKANVNVNGFGKLFTRAVDGQIYAQPLIATDVAVNGEALAEVVIVATPWPMYRSLASGTIASRMRRAQVIDPGHFLGEQLSGDARITYVSTGKVKLAA